MHEAFVAEAAAKSSSQLDPNSWVHRICGRPGPELTPVDRWVDPFDAFSRLSLGAAFQTFGVPPNQRIQDHLAQQLQAFLAASLVHDAIRTAGIEAIPIGSKMIHVLSDLRHPAARAAAAREDGTFKLRFLEHGIRQLWYKKIRNSIDEVIGFLLQLRLVVISPQLSLESYLYRGLVHNTMNGGRVLQGQQVPMDGGADSSAGTSSIAASLSDPLPLSDSHIALRQASESVRPHSTSGCAPGLVQGVGGERGKGGGGGGDGSGGKFWVSISAGNFLSMFDGLGLSQIAAGPLPMSLPDQQAAVRSAGSAINEAEIKILPAAVLANKQESSDATDESVDKRRRMRCMVLCRSAGVPVPQTAATELAHARIIDSVRAYLIKQRPHMRGTATNGTRMRTNKVS